MASIGSLTTFSKFINQYCVEIPRIQRDYTYGSNSAKTEKVLRKLLNDIHDALKTKNEVILDFVYGCSDNTFRPLDGQQRLTTLYLIYFYAACYAEAPIESSFKYATRDNSTIFCQELLGFKYEKNSNLSLVEQIKDSAFYRPSFDDDPSIRSMLVVLNRIDDCFKDMTSKEDPSQLFNLINADDCPVRFYCLDFGKFSLSDDLYIKMNSRGKQLTEYEIFKSQFEKYIEVELLDKDLKYETAKYFDNDYTDLIWGTQNRDKSKIDTAFVNLFKNIFLLINYKQSKGVKFDWKKTLYENMCSLKMDKMGISFIHEFMRAFISIKDTDFLTTLCYKEDNKVVGSDAYKIRFFKTEVDLFAKACTTTLNNTEVVTLYAIFRAIKHKDDADELWKLNFRHLRNLIEFSEDEISHTERLADMFKDIDNIFNNKILELDFRTKFNKTQFEEEQEKHRHIDNWKELFIYENHDILRGSLSLFADNNPEGKEFKLDNQITFKTICDRLEKFSRIFNDQAKDINQDHFIRACLLSVGDFSQYHNEERNKMVGCSYGSWRMMFTKSSYYKQTKIMSVLDQVQTPLKIQSLSHDEWRYYATNDGYYQQTYKSYGTPKYGYYYIADEAKPLEVWLLQSTSYGSDNVKWKLLNMLLYNTLNEVFDNVHLYKYEEEHAVRINNAIAIDALQEGWLIEDKTEEKNIEAWLKKNTNIKDGILSHPEGDYVKNVMAVIKKLSEEVEILRKFLKTRTVEV